ncbi:hypothetical protein DY000_02031441 [Brassica cretica]|uniref:Uncharacterized protein n=1 Tax=Brassica cretica TaxID=69181 RepID=A0ABQ7DDX8_BRACR|nr:hypothetical protein DY000_02031441 [Brassica cretica]
MIGESRNFTIPVPCTFFSACLFNDQSCARHTCLELASLEGKVQLLVLLGEPKQVVTCPYKAVFLCKRGNREMVHKIHEITSQLINLEVLNCHEFNLKKRISRDHLMLWLTLDQWSKFIYGSVLVDGQGKWLDQPDCCGYFISRVIQKRSMISLSSSLVFLSQSHGFKGDQNYYDNLGLTIEEHRPCHFRSSTIMGVRSRLASTLLFPLLQLISFLFNVLPCFKFLFPNLKAEALSFAFHISLPVSLHAVFVALIQGIVSLHIPPSTPSSLFILSTEARSVESQKRSLSPYLGTVY